MPIGLERNNDRLDDTAAFGRILEPYGIKSDRIGTWCCSLLLLVPMAVTFYMAFIEIGAV